MWKWYAILSALFASMTAILAKMGISGVNSDLATAIRTTVILFIVWGIALFSGAVKTAGSLTTKNIIFLILSGCATGLSWLFYFKALQMGDVSKVAPIDKLSVALTMVLAFLIFGEKYNLKSVIGGILVTAGVLTIAIDASVFGKAFKTFLNIFKVS